MTRTYRVTDIDIKRACSYITEDKAIADYFHVDIARVAALRKKTSQREAMKAERAQSRTPMPSTAAHPCLPLPRSSACAQTQSRDRMLCCAH